MLAWPRVDVNAVDSAERGASPLSTAIVARNWWAMRRLLERQDTDLSGFTLYGQSAFAVLPRIVLGVAAMLREVSVAMVARRRWSPLRTAWFCAAASCAVY